MTEYSRFFGGPVGSVPEYNQNNFAEVLQRLLSSGVLYGIANALAVVETSPASLAIRVNTGEGWIQGFWYQNTAYLTKALTAADATNPRIDRVVLRLDRITNFKISIEIIDGTPAASPSAPALTQDANTWEISLATVAVAANAVSIVNANITDGRTYSEVANNNASVKISGDETIADIKTFSSSPIVPTPSTATQAANKSYADALPIRENLLVNSAFKDTNEDGVPDWWALMATPTLAIAADTLCGFNDNHNQITITGAGAANEGIKIQGAVANWLKVRPSTVYVLSFYYKVTAGDNLTVHVHSYNGATEGTAHVTVANLSSTTLVRYEVSFTTDADATNLHIELKATADGDICIVSHPKLELGSLATNYSTSNKLKMVAWTALAFNLDFTTAVPATLTEANGDADQIPAKSVAFTKSDVAWLASQVPMPITFNGGSVLFQYHYYTVATSKTHTMELATMIPHKGVSFTTAIGSFFDLSSETSNGTTLLEQIGEMLVGQASHGLVAGYEFGLYLRRKNTGDTDEVYLTNFTMQYIEV